MIIKEPLSGTIYAAVAGETPVVRCRAVSEEPVTVNGLPAAASDGVWELEIPLTAPRLTLTFASGGESRGVELWRVDIPHRMFRLSADDNVRFLQDIAEHDYRSIFENPYLAVFAHAHERWGSKVHLNVFYESEDGSFNLSMMTDRFRDEFIRNSDWLSLTFHARREFPNAPYRTASYEEIYRDCVQCTREIIRFAGREVLRDTTTLHFGACTADGVRALRAFGFRGLCGYLTFAPDGETLVSYHLTHDQVAHAETREGWYDAAEDVVFAKLDFVLNDPVLTADRVAPFLDELARRPHERELIQMVIHEQYFYPDYALYEPDYAQRIWEMARWMHEHGYRSASLSEMIREEDARL